MNFVPVGFFLFFAVCVFGWIANIVKLIGVVNDPITLFTVLRAVGIFFAPLGVVLGFF